MCALKKGREFECVLVDVNTQHDFCDPCGAFPVANIPELIPALRRVVAWAKRNHLPLVSSLESHRPLELSDSGTPIHCVDGSCGQRKLSFTLFPARTNIEVDNTFAVPFDLFQRWQQVIFRKRSDDLLLNPKADRLLTQLPVREYLVFGTGLEGSVKAIALALMARGKRVGVVVDACGYWSRGTADLALRQLTAKGAQLVTTAELAVRRVDRQFRYPIHRNGHANGGVKRAPGAESCKRIPGRGAGEPGRHFFLHCDSAGDPAPIRPAGNSSGTNGNGHKTPRPKPLSRPAPDPTIPRSGNQGNGRSH
jgi:nicotinamidase-related amidase